MEKEIICYCKHVFKHEIQKEIYKNNALNLSEIQLITKASTGCGRCTNNVIYIIEEAKKLNTNLIKPEK